MHTIVYILNRVQGRFNNCKTPYELWYGITTTIKYFRIFERKCYIKRDKEDLGKFDSRTDEGVFLGYLKRSKPKRLKKMAERTNVKVDKNWNQTTKESKYCGTKGAPCIVEEDDEEKEEKESRKKELEKVIKTLSKYVQKNHS